YAADLLFLHHALDLHGYLANDLLIDHAGDLHRHLAGHDALHVGRLRHLLSHDIRSPNSAYCYLRWSRLRNPSQPAALIRGRSSHRVYGTSAVKPTKVVVDSPGRDRLLVYER